MFRPLGLFFLNNVADVANATGPAFQGPRVCTFLQWHITFTKITIRGYYASSRASLLRQYQIFPIRQTALASGDVIMRCKGQRLTLTKTTINSGCSELETNVDWDNIFG